MNGIKKSPIIVGSTLGLLCIALLAIYDKGGDKPYLQLHYGAASQARLLVGTVAPDFRLVTVAGAEIGLADLKGSAAILIFVTQNCQHCQNLKAQMLKLDTQDLSEQLVIITRTGRTLDDLPVDLRDIEKQIVRRFTVLEDSSGEVFDVYKATVVPTSYLIDGEGIVREAAVGPADGLAIVRQLMETNRKCCAASKVQKADVAQDIAQRFPM